MISKTSLNKIVHKLKSKELLKSLNECRKNERGGFLIPSSSKATDTDYEKYRHLPVNWSIPPISQDDLPEEFSPHAVKTVDMFRRKTYDLNFECMIYFDYKTGNIVSCSFSDETSFNKVQSIIFPHLIRNMSIASIHNHPVQCGTPPSGKNFEMLGLEFEEFELISSQKELWILESREKLFSDDEIEVIHKKIDEFYELLDLEINSQTSEDFIFIDTLNRVYGDFLLSYLNDEYDNIKLSRRYLHD